LLAPLNAGAQDNANTHPSDTKALKHTYSGKIDKVIDGLTILLTNGKIVRLSSIDIPAPLAPSLSDKADQNFHLAAKQALEDAFPAKSDVMIYQTRNAKKGRTSRMGHDLGHIVTKDEDKTWAQEILLTQGLARFYSSPVNQELSAVLFDIEAKAINEKIGLWSDTSPFKRQTPETAVQSMGQFTVIDGAPTKIATVRNNLYLNYGANWKTDFTVMISTSLRKKLAQQGINLMDLTGVPLRVRGWMREYNGPLIELEDINHLHILDKNSVLPATDERDTVNNP